MAGGCPDGHDRVALLRHPAGGPSHGRGLLNSVVSDVTHFLLVGSASCVGALETRGRTWEKRGRWRPELHRHGTGKRYNTSLTGSPTDRAGPGLSWMFFIQRKRNGWG